MSKLEEEFMEYICDALCKHAAEDSDYLVQRCEECRIKEFIEKIKGEVNTVKPILFNTAMVMAIIDGRKTVTRRVLRQPFEVHPNGYVTKPKGNERLCSYEPPYQKGDYLYVRETWGIKQSDNCYANSDKNCPYKSCDDANGKCFPSVYIYKASDTLPYGSKWHPSIHMPKEAARIFLRVTDVKLERLQDITEDGAIREGAAEYLTEGKFRVSSMCHFMENWNSTLKKEDIKIYGWDANPYVWVIEFERCAKPDN